MQSLLAYTPGIHAGLIIGGCRPCDLAWGFAPNSIIAFCSKSQPICCQFTQRADKNIRKNYKKIFKSAKLPQIPADIIDVRAIKALSRKRNFRECFAKQTPDGKSLAQSLSHKNKKTSPYKGKRLPKRISGVNSRRKIKWQVW